MLRHRGMSLLGAWTQALTARGVPSVVVGPDNLRHALPDDVILVREDPPLSGPAAAVHAGLRAHHESPQTGHVLILAVDVIDPEPLLDWLLAQVREGDAGARVAVVPVDAGGRSQYLASAVPVEELRHRVENLSTTDIAGRPLRVLFEGIDTVSPELPAGVGADIDAPADAARHGIDLPERNVPQGQ